MGTIIFCADFGATLDIVATEKEKYLVNNDADVCMFYVLYGWEDTSYNATYDRGKLLAKKKKNEKIWQIDLIYQCPAKDKEE